jgi:hypothetical protein
VTLKTATKNYFGSLSFFITGITLIKVNLHHFSKAKSHKELVTKYRSMKQGFSYYFLLDDRRPDPDLY